MTALVTVLSMLYAELRLMRTGSSNNAGMAGRPGGCCGVIVCNLCAETKN